MEILFVDFLNSDWRDYRVPGKNVDRLKQPAWIEGFLERWQLNGPGQLDAATLGALVALRALLQHMVDNLNRREQLSGADLGALNGFLRNTPVERELEKAGEVYKLRLVPVNRDWNWVMSEIVASFAGILAQNNADRLRVCENPDCRWVFYDESKNHSHRWCERNTCANLMKVRRFRARQREKAGN